MYIPYLPFRLMQALAAVGPFVVGMTRSDFTKVQQQVDVSLMTVVDLDNNQVFHLDPLLEQVGHIYTNFIQGQLSSIVDKYMKSTEHQLDLILRTEIKIEFVNLFLLILDNYLHHLRPEGITPGQLDSLPIDQIFNQSSYLASFTHHAHHHRFL